MSRREPSGSGGPPRAGGRGAVLVFVALISFALMGLAALVIDIGLARLSQRQMHAATDSIALEVLRERDLARNSDEEDSPYLRDFRRRTRNSRHGSWHYTPNLRTGQEGPDEPDFGPGAFVHMAPGFGSMNASALILEQGWSVPRPRPNYMPGSDPVPLNRRHGDVVSGHFTGHDPARPESDLGVHGNPMQLESSDYKRPDYEPSSAEDAPGGSAVVARMRRTVRPGDNSDTAGYFERQEFVSSGGPTLPFLFARGTTMHGGNPGSGYTPRFHGLGFRSTSIAAARPAVRIGIAPWTLRSTLPFSREDGYDAQMSAIVLEDWVWRGCDFGEQLWQLDGEGNLFLLLRVENRRLVAHHCDDRFAGFWWGDGLQGPYQDSAGNCTYEYVGVHRLGDRLTPLADEEADDFYLGNCWQAEDAYMPIAAPFIVFGQGIVYRTVGFTRVRITLENVPPAEPSGQPEQTTDPDAGEGEGGGAQTFVRVQQLRNALTPGERWLAPRNVSALFDGEQVDAALLADEGWAFTLDWTMPNPCMEQLDPDVTTLRGWDVVMYFHCVVNSLAPLVQAPALVR